MCVYVCVCVLMCMVLHRRHLNMSHVLQLGGVNEDIPYVYPQLQHKHFTGCIRNLIVDSKVTHTHTQIRVHTQPCTTLFARTWKGIRCLKKVRFQTGFETGVMGGDRRLETRQ